MSANSIEKRSTRDADKAAFQRMLASSLFILVVIIVGLPMWWKTTQVFRVPLPYDGIHALRQSPIQVRSVVRLYTANVERGHRLVEELRWHFAAGPQDALLLDVRQEQPLPDAIRASDTQTPGELVRKVVGWSGPVRAGEFLFVEWPAMRDRDVLVLNDRTALIASDTSSSKIQQVLRTWILEDHKILNILASQPLPANGAPNASDAQQRRSRQHHADRQLNPYPAYDVVISVLNPRPAEQRVHWDVRRAADSYLRPLFDSVRNLTRFRIKSQWIYQIPLEHPRREIADSTKRGRHFALDQSHLAHIVTALEGRLGQPISERPCLHLVVYVPPCSAAPLHVYDANGRRSAIGGAADAFLSPKWGAIVVANPPEALCADAAAHQPLDVQLDSEPIMQTLLYMTRRLLDIQNDVPISRAAVEPLRSVEARPWELDAFARTGCVQLLHSATITLTSLVLLLDNIGNIVINEGVGNAVREAYEELVAAKVLLAANRLPEAVIRARAAFDASERAFYDPSMLALLYFPDDQKFAIYIPLFLPMLLPIILSMGELWHNLVKWFRPAKEVEEKECDAKDDEEQKPVAEEEPVEIAEVAENSKSLTVRKWAAKADVADRLPEPNKTCVNKASAMTLEDRLVQNVIAHEKTD